MHMVLFPYCPALHGRHAAEPSGVSELAHFFGGAAPPLHSYPSRQGLTALLETRSLPGGTSKHASELLEFAYFKLDRDRGTSSHDVREVPSGHLNPSSQSLQIAFAGFVNDAKSNTPNSASGKPLSVGYVPARHCTHAADPGGVKLL